MIFECTDFIYRKHALERMLSRGISLDEVEKALINGEIIKEYPKDKPFKSYLILAIIEEKVLHIVVSQDEERNCIIITAYEPNKNIWEDNYKIKKI